MYDVLLDKYFAKSFTRILYIYQYELRWNYAKNCRPTVVRCFFIPRQTIAFVFSCDDICQVYKCEYVSCFV